MPWCFCLDTEGFTKAMGDFIIRSSTPAATKS